MSVTLTKPVPTWASLPQYAQEDLASKGCRMQLFDSLYPAFRLSVLNLYVKLHGTRIFAFSGWDYIRNITRADIGIIDFIPRDLALLRHALEAEPTFANPWGDDWDSRELRLKYSAHFKHKVAWREMVSVHIDPVGLYTGPGAARKVGAAVFGVPHLMCYYHYKQVEDIRSGLLSQGWDRTPLLGAAAGEF